MNRCPTARVKGVREDGQMGRRKRRWREAGSRSKGGEVGMRTCQGCHVMPAPDWAPAGGR